MLTNYTLTLEDIDIKEIETLTNNKSEWIRNCIKEKLGKKEKSLQELELSLETAIVVVENIEQQIIEKQDLILKQREQFTIAEINRIEKEKAEREKEEKEFIEKYNELIGNEPDIVNFDFVQNWNSIGNLMPLVEKFRAKNIKISFSPLRRYLAFKQQLASGNIKPV